MSHDAERDPVVRRAIDELQKLPQADASAIRRVVAAAAAARVTPADDEPMLGEPRRGFRFWTVAGIAAAAAFVGFALSSVARQKQTPVVAEAPIARGGYQQIANSSAEALPVLRQFIFNDRDARRVSLVGDFNGWNPSKAPMTREANSGLWSITVPIVPGRHIYGFMVNESTFVLDPNAPRARDRELGADGSVIIVGKP